MMRDKRGVLAGVDFPYYTTTQLSKILGIHPTIIWRWCRRWFGDLPPGRQGKGIGYAIPHVYKLVGQAWHLCEDEADRLASWEALIRKPALFVVISGSRVARRAVTCHTLSEATDRAIAEMEATDPDDLSIVTMIRLKEV